jgi:hypothetical protein
MSLSTPKLPEFIRTFKHPGYTNVYHLKGLGQERKLYCTETLLGDWGGQTLLLAKDAAPVSVIADRIRAGESDPWRHGERGRDPMGYRTNEKVLELSDVISGRRTLYGSALAHMLKDGNETSNDLSEMLRGPLYTHLTKVLQFVVESMPNLRAIVCLGKDSRGFVASQRGCGFVESLEPGAVCDATLFGRQLTVGFLYHPSRPFPGGWSARYREWQAVADAIKHRGSRAGQSP